jgi:hypothetical protein
MSWKYGSYSSKHRRSHQDGPSSNSQSLHCQPEHLFYKLLPLQKAVSPAQLPAYIILMPD